MFTSISSQEKNYQIIINQVKNAIIQGELKAGDQLPPERELVEIFNVSRSSVREALKALEVLGLVKSYQGGGCYIVNNILDSMRDSLSLYFMMKGGSLRDFIQLRFAIELSAAKWLIENGGDEDIEKLNAILQKYLNSLTTEDRQEQDQRFHTTLVSMSNNPLCDYLMSALSFIYLQNISYSHRVAEDKGDLAEVQDIHIGIYKAIKDRDYEAASRELLRHFDFTEDDIERQSIYFDKGPEKAVDEGVFGRKLTFEK